MGGQQKVERGVTESCVTARHTPGPSYIWSHGSDAIRGPCWSSIHSVAITMPLTCTSRTHNNMHSIQATSSSSHVQMSVDSLQSSVNSKAHSRRTILKQKTANLRNYRNHQQGKVQMCMLSLQTFSDFCSKISLRCKLSTCTIFIPSFSILMTTIPTGKHKIK